MCRDVVGFREFLGMSGRWILTAAPIKLSIPADALNYAAPPHPVGAHRRAANSTTAGICAIVRPMKFQKIFGVALAALLAAGAAPLASAEQPDIYPAPEQAPADLSAALKTAAARHLRVILDFGGNWCTDCHVLDIYMHDASNAPILEANFVVVHVNIGRKDSNLGIAARYKVPLDKGVPALAVLSSHGRLLYTQKAGEFEAMRDMKSAAVTRFLEHWKPRSLT